MRTFENISDSDSRYETAHGTYLQGYINTTKRELVERFGAPDTTGSGDNKITTEWTLVFSDGTVATIYDWKRYELGAPELDEVEDWHIGGSSHKAAEAVREALEQKQPGLAQM